MSDARDEAAEYAPPKSLRERIEARKRTLEDQLNKVNDALRAMESIPGLEEVVEIILRARML